MTSGAPASAAVRRRLPLLIQAACAIALAALVAFWGFDLANIAPDELNYQRTGLQYAQGDTSANPEHPPTAKYLLGGWQLLFGAGLTSARALMAILLVANALVAFLWLRAAFGPATALVATAMLVTTHRIASVDFYDRQVLLDPFSIAFGIAGLAVLWLWERHRHIVLAILAGALLAMAITSKASAATFLVGALAAVPWRELARREVWSAMLAFAAAGVATCLVVYAPLGGIDAVVTMIELQSTHAANGHLISVAGQSYQYAPWFAVLWFAGEVVGWVALIAIGVMALIGAALLWKERATRMIAIGGLASLVLLSASPVALPHYTAAWLWSPLLLSGIGIVELFRRARGRRGGFLAGAAAAVLLVGPVTGLAHILTIGPTGVARVDAAILADPAPDGTVLTLQLSRYVTDPNIDAPVSDDPAAEGITAVVIGDDLRFPADAALVDALSRHAQPIPLDDVELYILEEELPELLEREPVGSP